MAEASGTLIERYLPAWDVRSRQGTDVRAAPEDVYRSIRRLDLRTSVLVRWLFRLRGLWAEDATTLDGLLRRGFVILGEDPPRELLLGAVGRPWTLFGDLRRVDPEGFLAFDRPGHVRMGWNFTCEPRGAGATRLATETRVWCTDDDARRAFARYWRAIGPFSAVIRRQALASIRRAAEAR